MDYLQRLFSFTLYDWRTVGVALLVVFPILVILLSEVIVRLQRKGHPLTTTITSIRNWLLPALVILIMLRLVMALPTDSLWVKMAQTVFWVMLLHAALSFLNALLFAHASEDSWQARVPSLLRNISRIVLILIGLGLIASTVWQADLSGILAALGVGSIVIGLALQDTLSSFISGLLLLAERPFNEGEIINVGEIDGIVIEMNWRAVRIRAFDGRLVIIPNSVLAGETIRNLSRTTPLREQFQIGFSYDDPPNQVKQVLLETLLASPGVLNEPKPMVRTLTYADFSITYEVLFWINRIEDLLMARDEFISRIWYASKRHGLTIPYPIYTEFQHDYASYQNTITQKQRAVVRTQLSSQLAVSPEVLDHLAATLPTYHYSRGEFVVRQGAIAIALFVILKGQAVAAVKNEQGEQVEVTALSSGDYFGSMASLRGEPSDMSLIALRDLEVLLIDAQTALDLTRRQPNFASDLERVIDARRRASEAALISDRRQRELAAAGGQAGKRAGSSLLDKLAQVYNADGE